MSVIGETVVRVRADTRDVITESARDGARAGKEFSNAFNRHSKDAFDGFQKSSTQAVRGAAAGSGAFAGFGRAVAFASSTFLGTAGLVAGIKASITAASNLAEQTSKSRVLFGEFSAEIEKWSKTTANSYGIASDQAIEFAGTFGAIFRPLGIAQQESAQLSQKLVQTGADLASFYNTDVNDALLALKSGIVGETEPLRRYGVVINQARIQGEALTSGLVKAKVNLDAVRSANEKVAIAQFKYTDAVKKNGETSVAARQAHQALESAQRGLEKALAGTNPQLTAQQKILATMRLILHDTAAAQGDFARTGDGLANTQRKLSANIRETEIAVGKALLPTVLTITKRMNDWFKSSDNQARVSNAVKGAVSTLSDVIKAATPIVKTMADVVQTAVEKVGGLKHFIELLIGLKIASWVSGMIGPAGFGGIAGNAAQGTGAAGAAAKVAGLRGGLSKLAGMAAVTVGITLLIDAKGEEGYKAWLKKIAGAGLIGFALSGGSIPIAIAAAAAPLAYAAGQAVGKKVFGKGFDAKTDDKDSFVNFKPGSTVNAPESGTVTRIESRAGVSPPEFYVVFIGDGGSSWEFLNLMNPSGKGHKKKGERLGTVPPGGEIEVRYLHPDAARIPTTAQQAVPAAQGSAGAIRPTMTGGIQTPGAQAAGKVGGFPGTQGAARSLGEVSAPLERSGAHTKPIVIAMARRIAYIYGSALTLGAGTQHRQFVSGSNDTVQSDHWVGNAVDIPMTGQNLVKLGHAGLIAAGADRQWALKQGGGAYKVNGWQVIFACVLKQGGDHTNHMHLGWQGGSIPSLKETGGSLTASPDSGGGAPPAAPGGAGAASTPKVTGNKGGAGGAGGASGQTASETTATGSQVVGKVSAPIKTHHRGGADIPSGWAEDVLDGIGAPHTSGNIAFLQAWQRAEGGSSNNNAAYNPLCTTQWMPGSISINGVGVKAYISWQQGLEATIKTLLNGHYPAIVAALRAGGMGKNFKPTEAFAKQLETWSGRGYSSIGVGKADLVSGTTSTSPSSKTATTKTSTSTAQLETAGDRSETSQILRNLGITPSTSGVSGMIAAYYRRLTSTARQAILQAQNKAKQDLRDGLKQGSALEGEETDVIGTLLGLDPKAQIQTSDKYGRTITTTVGAVVTKAQAARRQLIAALAAKDPAAIAAAVQSWSDVTDLIREAISSGMQTAQQAAEAASQGIASAFSMVQSALDEVFDRQTQAGIASINASFQAQIDAVQAAAQAQVAAINAALQNRIESINAALEKKVKQLQADLKRKVEAIKAEQQQLTEQERRLAAFRLGRETAQTAQSMGDLTSDIALARIGGDPAAIRDAARALNNFLLDQTQARLEKEAEVSRTQRDAIAEAEQQKAEEAEQKAEERAQKQAEAEIAAAQKAAEARIAAIQEAAAAQVAALEQQRATAIQEYQDQRAEEKRILDEQLADWATRLSTGEASWDEFETWLQKQHPELVNIGGSLGLAFAKSFAAKMKEAEDKIKDLQRQLRDLKDDADDARDAILNMPSLSDTAGASGGNCFVAGTMVDTPDGERPIEEIKVGDEVVVWDFGLAAPVASPVTQTFRHYDSETLLTIITEDWNRHVTTTPEHPFWAGGAWTPAGDLREGDQLGPHTIAAIRAAACFEPVYNLHVEHDDHCYFANGYLVHNKITEFASGGTLRGNWRGRDSALSLTSPGETWIDRRLTAALERVFLGGGGGSGDGEALAELVRLLRASLAEQQKQTDLLGEPAVVIKAPHTVNDVAFEASR